MLAIIFSKMDIVKTPFPGVYFKKFCEFIYLICLVNHHDICALESIRDDLLDR